MSGTRVAIVTGASSGVGLAVTRILVARGERVAMVARSEGKLAEAARDLGADRAVPFPLDVGDRAALLELPRRVVERFGRLDVVVNNAGLNHRGPVRSHTAAELAAIIDVNLTAPIVLTRAALPHLHGGGVIVNVASLAGMVPVPHEATYSASKAGLRAFARALGVELADEARSTGLPPVRVATVCPGPIDTGFLGDLEHVPDLVLSQPMRSAEQVAEAVIACIDGDREEIAMPLLSGKLATLGYVFPKLATALRPVLAKRGAANKRRYIAQRRG